ncbi:MAG: hypothetical protein WKG01_31000 [Kofleriaceae bacterium]
MRIFTWGTLVLATGSLVACGPGGRNSNGGDDDDDNDGTDGGNPGGGDGGGNANNCSEEAKLVYVVDEDDTFSKFDPATRTFTDLGRLDCPAGFSASPFSMSVDRDAFAWVLYSNDDLFRVDVKDLSSCTKTTWNSPNNLNKFGMGFSTDIVGGTTDTLFIAGGEDGPTGGSSNLAAVDTGGLTAQGVGSIAGWPELTGTGNAELWGFFPSSGGSTPRISRIDKATAGMPTNYPLSSLAGTPKAWAFAAWGGDFWVFLKKGSESSTRVYQVDGMTGMVEGMTTASGRSIVGAGVSTCAPVVVQ